MKGKKGKEKGIHSEERKKEKTARMSGSLVKFL